MWFIGLLIGMLIGSAFRFGEGTIWGGMLGALVGAVISFSRGQTREPKIEARLAALEFAVRKLQEKTAQSPGAPAAAPPEAAMAPGGQAVPPDFPRPAEDEIRDWE
jgi:hypothetical protein